MKRFVLVALVVGLALAVQGAWALTLHPSVVGSWDSNWVSNGNGVPYWDNNSGEIRLGDYVSTNWGTLPTLVSTAINEGAPGSGAWVTDVSFTSGDSDWATILIEVAGLAPNNYFGIYKKDDPNTRYQLFAGAAGPNASATFNPMTAVGSSNFGFYLETKAPNGDVYWRWYSQSQYNEILDTLTGDDENQQHFAFFDAKEVTNYPSNIPGYKPKSGGGYEWPWGNAYIIGVEDLPISREAFNRGPADKDYNDFVVFVANVPDASTWMLFLSGMPAVLMLRRKRS